MAEVQPPTYQDGECYTPQQDRALYSSIVCVEGVAFGSCGGDLQVVDGPGGLQVTVLSGSAFIEGDNVACQGMYHVQNDGDVVLTLGAADPTDPRIDLIVATVSDTTYGGATNSWELQVVPGTPSPVPTAPAVPDNSIVLAEVRVNAGAADITPADITDRRSGSQLCGSGAPTTVIFTSNGTFTKSDYSGNWVRVRVQAGGGGGGGVNAGSGDGCGSGGGGGEYVESVFAMEELPESSPVVVGAGGVGNGGVGGNSTFANTLVVAIGGAGGSQMPRTTGTDRVAPGNGGSGGTGDLLAAGSDGGVGVVVGGNRINSGYGGSSRLGGSQAAPINGNGANGQNYGGGGAGATGNSNPLIGGAGAPGIVIVDVY